MKTKNAALRMVVATAALMAAHCWAGPAKLPDSEAISTLIKTTWEKPGMTIHVDPVSVSGDYAVAGWVEGERGGRALLKRNGEVWSVILCSGDGIKTAPGLVAAGVPPADAQVLETALVRQEAALPADIVNKFSLFEGSVPVGDGKHEGHHDHH